MALSKIDAKQYRIEAPREGFGKALRECRRTSGLAVAELGAAMNVSASHITSIEKGNRAPPAPERILAAAEAMGLSYEHTDRLLATAALARGHVELPVHESRPAAIEAAVALELTWSKLDDTRLRKLCDFILDITRYW